MRLLPYARLLRIPNVFTALADIALGACAASMFRSEQVDLAFIGSACGLLLAAACLYCAGMVWNDYFDLEEDRHDRPFRPLPSGQVSTRIAFWLGLALMAVGWLSATASGQSPLGWMGVIDGTPFVISAALIVAILLYDSWLKRTPFGPFGMGACRFLNVLLGMTLARGSMPWPTQLHVAAAVGVYIVGVTWFARTEATASNAQSLRGAALVMLAALGIALAVPVRVPPDTGSPLYPYLLVAFGFYLGFPVTAAIEQPTPQRVQAAVKRSILGLIALDAILATAFVGTWGLLVLLLL